MGINGANENIKERERKRIARCRMKNDADKNVDAESSGASTEPNALWISSSMRQRSQVLFVELVVVSSVWGWTSAERWGSPWHSTTAARAASDDQ